jgi:hypothetical protein
MMSAILKMNGGWVIPAELMGAEWANRSGGFFDGRTQMFDCSSDESPGYDTDFDKEYHIN